MRLLVLLFSLLTFVSNAQETHTTIGATSTGLGKSATTIIDGFSIVNNTATAVKLKTTNIAFNTDTRFFLSELFSHHLALSIPVSIATLGIDLSYQGFSDYNITTTGISFAKAVHQRLAFGLRVNYHQTNTSENFNTKTFQTQTSLYSDINESVALAMNAIIYHGKNHQLFKLGGCFHEDDWKVITDFVWDTFENPFINLGAQYKLYQCLIIRIGMAENLTYPTLGLGLDKGKLSINTAMEYHQSLGITPTFDLIVSLEK